MLTGAPLIEPSVHYSLPVTAAHKPPQSPPAGACCYCPVLAPVWILGTKMRLGLRTPTPQTHYTHFLCTA